MRVLSSSFKRYVKRERKSIRIDKSCSKKRENFSLTVIENLNLFKVNERAREFVRASKSALEFLRVHEST